MTQCSRRIMRLLASLFIALSACERARPSINEVVWAIQDAQADFFEKDQNRNGVKDYWKGAIQDLRNYSPRLDEILTKSGATVGGDPMGLELASFRFSSIPFASRKSPTDQYHAILVAQIGGRKEGGNAYLIICTPTHVHTFAKRLSAAGLPLVVPEGLVENREIEGWLCAPGRTHTE